jgi:hypothetical protein
VRKKSTFDSRAHPYKLATQRNFKLYNVFISCINWLKHVQQEGLSVILSLAKAPAQVAPLQVHWCDTILYHA